MRICYKRKGPRTKKLIFLVYKCATVINAVHSSLSPFTSRENGVVLHKSGSNFPLVCSFKWKLGQLCADVAFFKH